MTEPQAKTGLCSTCLHAEDCSITNGGGSGVFQCSEYEPAGQTSFRAQEGATSGSSHREANLLGLCADCANREQCAFPKPEGGVWHCEEYAAE
jgi:hypothetical protein